MFVNRADVSLRKCDRIHKRVTHRREADRRIDPLLPLSGAQSQDNRKRVVSEPGLLHRQDKESDTSEQQRVQT